MRKPAKMAGAAAGSTILRSTWVREAPMLRADHTSTRSTVRTPAALFTTTG